MTFWNQGEGWVGEREREEQHCCSLKYWEKRKRINERSDNWLNELEYER
jgi:hypothetical protein